MADQQRFSLTKLNNHNYQSWKFKMEMMLIRDELWHVISDDAPTPVTWTKARATIGLCIDDNQTSLVRNCANAKAAWTALKEYHDKGSEVYLLKKLTRLELPEHGDMEQHLQQFTDLLQRIADTGEPIPDKWQVAMLLCSLPDSFDPLATALEQRPRDELTLDLIKSKLLAEAEKRRERAGTGSSSGEKALRTDFRRRGGGSGNGTSGEQKEPKKKSEVKAKQASVTEGPLAWMVGHGEPASWFVDSDASRHMTGDEKFFTTLEESTVMSVLLADGEKAEVAGIGRGKLVVLNGAGKPVDIVLGEVLFVPRLTSGLISVSTLTTKSFHVVFNDNRS